MYKVGHRMYCEKEWTDRDFPPTTYPIGWYTIESKLDHSDLLDVSGPDRLIDNENFGKNTYLVYMHELDNFNHHKEFNDKLEELLE